MHAVCICVYPTAPAMWRLRRTEAAHRHLQQEYLAFKETSQNIIGFTLILHLHARTHTHTCIFEVIDPQLQIYLHTLLTPPTTKH